VSLSSPLLDALTVVFAKIGLEGVDSGLATFIRKDKPKLDFKYIAHN